MIARLEAEHDPAQSARQWLEGLQGRVTLVDVVSPLGPDTADAKLRALPALDVLW